MFVPISRAQNEEKSEPEDSTFRAIADDILLITLSTKQAAWLAAAEESSPETNISECLGAKWRDSDGQGVCVKKILLKLLALQRPQKLGSVRRVKDSDALELARKRFHDSTPGYGGAVVISAE